MPAKKKASDQMINPIYPMRRIMTNTEIDRRSQIVTLQYFLAIMMFILQ